jgi:3alpha(or 20beta)-hydroxysteroid dehydrogenase
MSGLEGKVAIITGAAQGQGAAEARRLINGGCTVVLGDILDEVGEATAQELGERAYYTHLDVSEEADWTKAVSLAEEVGSLQVLVNNAGLSWLRAVEDETPETMERMWRVNLLGAFIGMKASVPAMRAAGGGSIVNISSVAGLMGMAYNGAYGASKWALRGLTKTCAIEFGQYNIRVNSVHPGPIDTGMLPAGPPDVSLDERYKHLPLRRVGQPDEVAALVEYLASDESRFVTGGEFVIDGGFHAGPPMPPTPPIGARSK